MSYTNVDQVRRYEPVAVTNMRLHVLTKGFRYNLLTRRPEPPTSKANNPTK
jgi:cyanophycinase-like exopeptidase